MVILYLGEPGSNNLNDQYSNPKIQLMGINQFII